MPKKIFSLMLVPIFLLTMPVATAAYPKYLNDDRNYVLFDGYQGGARYIVRNSLNVELCDPPNYDVSVDWVYVPDADRGAVKITQKLRTAFRYDTDTRQLFTVFNDGKLNPLKRNAARAEGSALLAAAEIAFYLATSRKFFGDFSDDFYPDF